MEKPQKPKDTPPQATIRESVPPIIRLGRDFTQVHIPPEKRTAAIQAAYWVTASPCEWVWTPEQQADMARYVLWASQRMEAMQHIAEGLPLLHEEEHR